MCAAGTVLGGKKDLGKKTKLKVKGKRLYKNTHGNCYRVKPNFRLSRMMQQRKRMRTLNSQMSA
jgi:hypothetical protein